MHPTGQSPNLTPAAKVLVKLYRRGTLRWREHGVRRRITDHRGLNVAAIEKRQTSLTASQVADLATRYEAGVTIRELAEQSGAHPETVVRHLVGAGVELRRLGLTEEGAEAARRLYLDEGLTLAEVAVRQGVAASTVRACLQRQGVSLRPASRRPIRPA